MERRGFWGALLVGLAGVLGLSGTAGAQTGRPVYHPGHRCPGCGRTVYTVYRRGPGPGRHTHRCPGGTLWWH
jgi:hypothetical protein